MTKHRLNEEKVRIIIKEIPEEESIRLIKYKVPKTTFWRIIDKMVENNELEVKYEV